jgi:hypothetical protein
MGAPARAALILVVVGLAVLVGCQRGRRAPGSPYMQLAQRVTITGTYRHPASGMALPPSVGEFTRTSLIRYGQGARSVHAQYEIDGATSKFVAGVYVYPAPNVTGSLRAERCSSQLDAASTDLGRSHPGMHGTGLDDVALEQEGASHRGRRANFAYDEPSGLDMLPSVAQIYLFCPAADGWQVEYRFTRPRELDAAPIIDDFMQQLTWTLKPGYG